VTCNTIRFRPLLSISATLAIPSLSWPIKTRRRFPVGSVSHARDATLVRLRGHPVEPEKRHGAAERVAAMVRRGGIFRNGVSGGRSGSPDLRERAYCPSRACLGDVQQLPALTRLKRQVRSVDPVQIVGNRDRTIDRNSVVPRRQRNSERSVDV
jgi:hypothetical protein